jgi:hypothetical protein
MQIANPSAMSLRIYKSSQYNFLTQSAQWLKKRKARKGEVVSVS